MRFKCFQAKQPATGASKAVTSKRKGPGMEVGGVGASKYAKAKGDTSVNIQEAGNKLGIFQKILKNFQADNKGSTTQAFQVIAQDGQQQQLLVPPSSMPVPRVYQEAMPSPY